MPVYESPGAGRVLIAVGADPLVAEPTWTRYDELSNCRCEGFDVNRGRQSEFDTTDTGSARVFFHDRAQVLNDDDLIGLQIMLQVYDPVAAAWTDRVLFLADGKIVKELPRSTQPEILAALEAITTA